MVTALPTPRVRRVRRRLPVVAASAILIGALGLAFSLMPPLFHVPLEVVADAETGPALADARREPQLHVAQARMEEVRRRFDEAVVMLHAREFEYAAASLHRLLELSPRMPEAHVNMGYALLGLGRRAAARDFFRGAIELNARQANAYYGLAVAHEGLDQLPEAIGAMRSYLHLSERNAAHRSRASAALWEWEDALARADPDRAAGARDPRSGEAEHE